MIVGGNTSCLLLVLSMSLSFSRVSVVFGHQGNDVRSIQPVIATLAMTAFLSSGCFAIQQYGTSAGIVQIALGVLISLTLDRWCRRSMVGPVTAALSLALYLAVTDFPG